jgi:hypothetical protein
MIGIGELKMTRSRQRMADGRFTAAAWPDEKDWLCHYRRPLVPHVAENENERSNGTAKSPQ